MRYGSDNKEQLNNQLLPYDSTSVFDLGVVLMVLFSMFASTFLGNLPKENVVVVVITYLCAPLSAIIAIALLGLKKRQNVFIQLKPQKSDVVTIIAMFLITLGMMFGLSSLNEYFVDFLQFLGLKQSPITLPTYTLGNFITVFLFICIIPPITEEMFFRGAILKGMQGIGELGAILVSGALFSLFHMSPQQTIYQFIAGCLYAFIVLRGGDWSLIVLSHFINNAFIVVNFYFINFYPKGTLLVILTVAGLVLLLLGILLLVKNKKENKKIYPFKSLYSGVPVGIMICLFMWVAGLIV